jgi:hypothetical protein
MDGRVLKRDGARLHAANGTSVHPTRDHTPAALPSGAW